MLKCHNKPALKSCLKTELIIQKGAGFFYQVKTVYEHLKLKKKLIFSLKQGSGRAGGYRMFEDLPRPSEEEAI